MSSSLIDPRVIASCVGGTFALASAVYSRATKRKLEPNSGSSVKDQLNRQDLTLTVLREASARIEDRQLEQDKRLSRVEGAVFAPPQQLHVITAGTESS